MAPKSAQKAPAAKPTAKKESKSDAKEPKKAKGAKGDVEPSDEEVVPAEISADAREEAEEEAEEAAASGGGGNAAALAAAAAGNTEMSASFKNFRHHPDMENFYRFIYENDLRHEALAIIDQMAVEKQNKKTAKGGKLSAH